MYNCYIEHTDHSNPIYFEVDPITSPSPECIKDIKKYTSVMSFKYDGSKVNPRVHTIDAGVPTGSGIIKCTFKHLSKGIFDSLDTIYKSKPPIQINFYDYRNSTLYESVIIGNLIDNSFIEGVEDTINLAGTNQKVVDGSFEIHTISTPA